MAAQPAGGPVDRGDPDRGGGLARVEASLASVTDAVNGTIADVACGVTFPHTLAAGQTPDCTYEADLGNDNTATQNTATARLQNTPSGATGFTGTAGVTVNEPTTEIDACVTVSDSLDTDNVPPALACADEAPRLFDYERFIGPFEEPEQCGAQGALNTASFETEDIEQNTGQNGSAEHAVSVNVTCGNGGGGTCTPSHGYWKTHSARGPAPYDANRQNLGSEEENTIFFYSGQTHREVLWTPPAGGNAYYNLARRHIVAKLNGLNGSDLSAVQSAFDTATGLFNSGQNTPSYIGGLRANHTLRQQFIQLAGILGAFNEDNHCHEHETSG